MSNSISRKVGKSGLLSTLFSLVVVLGMNPSAHATNPYYYVDPNYTGTNGAPYGVYAAAYNSVSAALAGVGSGASATSPNYIYFAPGTYNVGTSSLTYSKNNVDFVGLTGNPADVVITSTLDSAYKVSGTAIGTTGSATLSISGNNVSASFLTIANSTDTPYIDNVTHLAESPTGTFPTVASGGTAQTATAPAVALLINGGDQDVFNNVNLVGYQDTLYDKGGRTYFNNSYISGDDDMIWAQGTGVFNNSTINMDSDHSGGAVTAASTAKTTSNGFVFLNSKLTGNSTAGNSVTDPYNAGNTNPTPASSIYLGRSYGWTQAGGDAGSVWINTKIATNGGTSIVNPAGWLAWDANETNPSYSYEGGPNPNNGNPMEDGRFAEYNSTDLLGNPVNTSSRVYSHQLPGSLAADYTVDNVFGAYNWYGAGYTATDTDTYGNGTPVAGSSEANGSANPTDPNFSWPAYWGDRNINNETTSETAGLNNDPISYTNSLWKLGGTWDPTNQTNMAANADSLVPEPGSTALIGGLIMLPLALRPRRRSLAR